VEAYEPVARPVVQVMRPSVRAETPPVAELRPKISVRNLNFYYGAFRALHDISWMSGKEVTAFIGPSGCGKSTLLRTLNRLYSLYPISAPKAR